MNPNDPAFPCPQGTIETNLGLTKREWFAGMALAGLCARERPSSTETYKAWAAVAQADALIKELEKNQ